MAPIDYVGIGRLHGAWTHDRAGDLTKILIEASTSTASELDAALITAASHGEPEMVSALIDSGVNLETVGTAAPGSGTALAHAVHYGMVDSIDRLIAAGAVVHDLVEAAGAGDIGEFLPATPAQTVLALRAAAVCERLDVVDELLNTGIDVNAQFTTMSERSGATALHCAAREGKAASVECLLSRGADPDRVIDNLTALDWCRRRHAEIGPGWGHEEVDNLLADSRSSR